LFSVLILGLLAAPSVAFAATTWSNLVPTNLGVISTNKPTISVLAVDGLSNITTGTLTVDGFSLGTLTMQRPVPADLRRAILVLDTSGSAGLSWGVHTVTATVRNASNVVSTRSWTFTADAPPTVASVWPADGEVVRTTTNPVITVTLDDPDDTTFVNPRFYVDGGRAWSGTGYTITYDEPTKTYSLESPSGWNEGETVNMVFNCEDAAGGLASKTWSFLVDTRPDTQAPDLSNPTPIPGSTTNARPLFGITAFDNMPGNLDITFTLDGTEVYSQSRPQGTTSWTPGSDLALTSHTVVVSATDAASNTSTYEWTFTATDPDSARHMTTTPFTQCAGCHNPVISQEHANRGFTCDAPCHTSTDPIITGAIDAGNKACDACHTDAVSAHTALHQSDLTRPDCVECHDGNIATEHQGDCVKCHASTNVAVVAAISGHQSKCGACHTPSMHPPGFFRVFSDYYTWTTTPGPRNTGPALSTIGANPENPGAHANYLANTAKCGMCHSVHRAAGEGVKLLPTADATCAGCHAGGTAITAKIVTWASASTTWTPTYDLSGNITNAAAAGGGGGPHNDSAATLIEDGLWDGTGTTPEPGYEPGHRYGCFTRRCHATNPHGANGSKYSIFATKFLFNEPASADEGGVGTYGGLDAVWDDLGATDAAVERFVLANSSIMSTTAAGDILINGAAPDEAETRALVAGLTCGRPSNPSTGEDECHAEASYAIIDKAIQENRNKGTGLSGSAYRTDNTGGELPGYGGNDSRTMKTGHVAGTFAAVPDDASYAPIAGCTSCHDQTDANNTIAGNFTFPHGQTPTGATNLYLSPDGAQAVGVRSRLWAGYSGSVGATLTYSAGTAQKAFDGQCLKCHRDGTGSGIGLDQ
jgi:hypothetical protein